MAIVDALTNDLLGKKNTTTKTPANTSPYAGKPYSNSYIQQAISNAKPNTTIPASIANTINTMANNAANKTGSITDRANSIINNFKNAANAAGNTVGYSNQVSTPSASRPSVASVVNSLATPKASSASNYTNKSNNVQDTLAAQRAAAYNKSAASAKAKNVTKTLNKKKNEEDNSSSLAEAIAASEASRENQANLDFMPLINSAFDTERKNTKEKSKNSTSVDKNNNGFFNTLKNVLFSQYMHPNMGVYSTPAYPSAFIEPENMVLPSELGEFPIKAKKEVPAALQGYYDPDGYDYLLDSKLSSPKNDDAVTPNNPVNPGTTANNYGSSSSLLPDFLAGLRAWNPNGFTFKDILGQLNAATMENYNDYAQPELERITNNWLGSAGTYLSDLQNALRLNRASGITTDAGTALEGVSNVQSVLGATDKVGSNLSDAYNTSYANLVKALYDSREENKSSAQSAINNINTAYGNALGQQYAYDKAYQYSAEATKYAADKDYEINQLYASGQIDLNTANAMKAREEAKTAELNTKYLQMMIDAGLV